MLRTAQALAAAQVPAKRITRSMRELRRHLPESMPLSGLTIGAVADRVVVREGARRWQAESGQYLLASKAIRRRLAVRTGGARRSRPEHGAAPDAEALLERALASRKRTSRAPRHVSRGDTNGWRPGRGAREPRPPAARARPPRRGRDRVSRRTRALSDGSAAALQPRRRAGRSGPQGRGRTRYEAALDARPRFADCHYNLALLCEALGRPRDAIRHMAHYRRLSAGKK